MNFNEEQLAMLSPAEQELARDAMAAAAAGRDVLAEADADAPGAPPTPTIANPAPAPAPAADAPAPAPAPAPTEAAAPAPAPAPADAPAPAPAAAAPAPAPAAAEVSAPAPAPVSAPAPDALPHAPATPTFRVDEQQRQQLVDQRKNLRTKIAEIDKKWGAGDISDEDRQAQLAPLQDQIDDITGNLAVIQSLEASSTLTVEQQQRAAIGAIMERGAQVGLDYAKTAGLQRQFNAIMDGLEADPENAKLTFTQLAEKAHGAMLAIHGKLSQQAAPAPAPAPAPAAAAPATPPARQVPAAPTTLRDIPAAARANEGFAAGGLADQVLAGNAIDAEERWGRLTKAQRDALLNG